MATPTYMDAYTGLAAIAALMSAEEAKKRAEGKVKNVPALEIMRAIAARGLLAPCHRELRASTSFTSKTETPALCLNVLNLTRPGSDKVKPVKKSEVASLTQEEKFIRLMALGLGNSVPSVDEVLDVSAERQIAKIISPYLRALVFETSTGIYPVSIERSYAFDWSTRAKPSGDRGVLVKEISRRVHQSVVFILRPNPVVVEDSKTRFKMVSMIDDEGTWPAHIEVRSKEGIIPPENILKVLAPLEMLPVVGSCYPADRIVPVFDSGQRVSLPNYEGMFIPSFRNLLRNRASFVVEVVAPDYFRALNEVVLRNPDLKLMGIHVARFDENPKPISLQFPEGPSETSERLEALFHPLKVEYHLETRASGGCLVQMEYSSLLLALKKGSAKSVTVATLLELTIARVSFLQDRLTLLRELQARDDLFLFKVREEELHAFDVIIPNAKMPWFRACYEAKRILEEDTDSLARGGSGAYSGSGRS